MKILAALICLAVSSVLHAETPINEAKQDVAAIMKAYPAYIDDEIMTPMETDAIGLVAEDFIAMKGVENDDAFIAAVQKLDHDFKELIYRDNFLMSVRII